MTLGGQAGVVASACSPSSHADPHPATGWERVLKSDDPWLALAAGPLAPDLCECEALCTCEDA